MSTIKWAVAAAVLSLSLLVSGCAKKASEAEQQLADTQKQLDEANKKLESAGMKPVPAMQPAAAAPVAAQGVTPGAAPRAAENAAGKPNSGSGSPTGKTDSIFETGKPGWGDSKPAATGPVMHTIPAGTAIAVRTLSTVSTKTAASGSPFTATLNQPLEVDGYLVAPRGATVEGVVVNSDPGGRVKGVASITVGLRRIVLADGGSLAISTGNHSAVANSSKGKDAMKVGIASGIGAAIGAIAGGGKGAAIGAGAGAAGGTGMVLGTRGEAAVIPAESVMTFKLTAPVTVQEPKH